MPLDEPAIVGAKSLSSFSLSDGEGSSPNSKLRHRLTSTLQSQHPFEDQEKLQSCVRLLDGKSFKGLPNPLPRAQDVPEECFGTPRFGDEVISVSHAWRNQAHPDPTSCKTKLLVQLLSQLNLGGSSPARKAVSEVWVHCFACGPGRPWRRPPVQQPPTTGGCQARALTWIAWRPRPPGRRGGVRTQAPLLGGAGSALQPHPVPARWPKRRRVHGGPRSRASAPAARQARLPEQESRVFLFLDFISIPQKPFREDQRPRTPDQARQFQAALECMHEVFYHSDRIIHLPWENVPVPGEGIEGIVPAMELRNAVFAQVDDVVQIAGYRTMPLMQANSSSSSGQQVHLFDQVVSVDDQEASTVAQVEDLLRNDTAMVRLRSYPFGMSNSIPADARGWVFLERFISMVKCAMVDEETAKQIIITPSEQIFHEIMNGASRLRDAALQDMRSRRSEELKQVLESFIVELHNKEFTAASTDKRELQRLSESTTWEDRNIVHSIMQEFVAHLAVHWEAEASKQRSLAARLNAVVAATEGFLLQWDSFSEDYASRLANASTTNPWPVVVVVVVPVVITAGLLLAPYANPDESWTEHSLFWGCSSMMWVMCYTMFPTFLAHTAGMPFNGALYGRVMLWAVIAAAALQLTGIGLASGTNMFPVPVLPMFSAAVGVSLLPSLWWCIPARQRSSARFRARLVCSLVALSLVTTLLGTFTPLLNAAIPHVSLGWQVVLVGGYLANKLMVEGAGIALSRHLGADAMPNIVFLATCCYQINLCMAFSKVSSWWIVVEQICFDVLENAYHLWGIRSPRNTAGHEQYIVAVLVLREFVELMMPLQFLILHWLVKRVRPEYSILLCNKSEAEMRHTELVLQADISVEFIVSFLTYIFLVRRGHAPLRILRGLVATRFALVASVAGAVLPYYCTMAHTLWGMDLSFRFLWLFEAEAAWECGLTWHVPESR